MIDSTNLPPAVQHVLKNRRTARVFQPRNVAAAEDLTACVDHLRWQGLPQTGRPHDFLPELLSLEARFGTARALVIGFSIASGVGTVDDVVSCLQDFEEAVGDLRATTSGMDEGKAFWLMDQYLRDRLWGTDIYKANDLLFLFSGFRYRPAPNKQFAFTPDCTVYAGIYASFALALGYTAAEMRWQNDFHPYVSVMVAGQEMLAHWNKVSLTTPRLHPHASDPPRTSPLSLIATQIAFRLYALRNAPDILQRESAEITDQLDIVETINPLYDILYIVRAAVDEVAGNSESAAKNRQYAAALESFTWA